MCCDCMCVCVLPLLIFWLVYQASEIVTPNRRIYSQKVWFNCNRKCSQVEDLTARMSNQGLGAVLPLKPSHLLASGLNNVHSSPDLSDTMRRLHLDTSLVWDHQLHCILLFRSYFLSAVALKLWNLSALSSLEGSELYFSWCLEGNVFEKEFTILSSILSPPGSYRWPLPSLHNDSSWYNRQLPVRAREDVWQTNIVETQVRRAYAHLGSTLSRKTGSRCQICFSLI